MHESTIQEKDNEITKNACVLFWYTSFFTFVAVIGQETKCEFGR